MLGRHIAELMCRDRCYWRRLPARFGSRLFLTSPDAALRWLRPGVNAFDQHLLSVVDDYIKPGMVVWDIGSNVGAFTFPAAHIPEVRVLAVEADPFLTSLLAMSAAANPDLRITVVQAAVTDHDGTATFAIAGRGRAASGLAQGVLSTQHGRSRAICEVPAVTLDELLKTHPAPDFVKIDIEGGEVLALAGAEMLLREIRPPIYVEIVEENLSAAADLLKRFGYTLNGSNDEFLAMPAATPQKCHFNPGGGDVMHIETTPAVERVARGA